MRAYRGRRVSVVIGRVIYKYRAVTIKEASVEVLGALLRAAAPYS